jgi:hypothetical protein
MLYCSGKSVFSMIGNTGVYWIKEKRKKRKGKK